jgi:PPE-repeat protein
MSSETYAIVFKGDIVEGFEAAAVQAQLARLLKIDAKKIAALFSGKQIVLKKTADKTAAVKYGKALKKVGADVKIRVIKAAASKPAPAAPVSQTAEAPVTKKAAAPTFQKADEAPAVQAADTTEAAAASRVIDTSSMTVAPNEGDLFEAAPEVEVPDIDLSGYSVAENDGSLLVEPAEEVVVEIDLSEFSVAENDGTPLIEPSAPVPKVEAPDFGLDEPGAVLETLVEEKELLNPNTMGMTLAMAGSDMIEEDEKPPAPTPVSPDTSKINLVPNFDT